MYLSNEKLGRAFFLVIQLQKELTRGPVDGDKPVISVDQLKDLISARRGCAIEAFEVPFEAMHVRGRLERWVGNRAVVHIRSNQDLGWKRFVAAKEYLHLIVDQEPDFNPYGDETLEELIRQGHFGQASFNDVGGEPAQSEIIAEIAALEVLYPINFRQADVEALQDKQTTVVRLAHRYGIPPSYVATAIDPKYLRTAMDSVNSVLKDAAEDFEKYML